MIRIKLLVIHQIHRHLNCSLDFAMVVAVAADPVITMAEVVVVPLGAALFNVNYATSQAARASTVGTASTKTFNHLHHHRHRMRTSPPHILLPS